MNIGMHTEIETITNPYWFNSISKDNIEKCYQFLDKYYNKDINTSTIKLDFIRYQAE